MLNKTSMWDMVNSAQLRTFIYLPQEICCEGETNMPGIPIRSVRGVFARCGLLEKTMQGIKAQNVFIQPHTANLKHKIEEFRRTHVIKDLSRVKVFIIQSQQHQFTSVTALPASVLPLKA